MLLPRVRRFAARHHLWGPGTRVIAAVSGGSDSVAMLLLLHDLQTRGELQLDAVAHLNHSIRAEADEDEAFCRALVHRLSLPFVTRTVDVPAIARHRKQSMELAGRVVRRVFLDELRRERGADVVATAHTLDDQAETVLLRLLRGAGAHGLAAIAPAHGPRIRPVLCTTRAELQEELRRRDQPWREDVTNRDVSQPRNRIRHELLPYLERHFNPRARHALARVADLARADDELLARQAAAASVGLVERTEAGVRLSLTALRELPESLCRRVIQYALCTAGAGQLPACDDVEAVRAVVMGRRAAADVLGLRVEPSGGFAVLVKEERHSPGRFRMPLPVPGHVRLEQAGWIVEAAGPFPRDRAAGVDGATGRSRQTVQIAADELGPVLTVRSRQPGDRLRPLGLGGRKKVQDVLVDRKVGRQERDLVPIVSDARGRIVWVAGHVSSEEFRVTGDTKAVIILKLRRI